MRYAEHGESGPGKVPAQPTTVSRMSAAPRRCQSEWCHADRSDLRAQEASSERLERRRVTGGEEPMHWRGAVRVAQEVVGREDAINVLGRLLRAGHQRHVRAHDIGDDSGQQRIVRAAQDERVAAGLDDRREVLSRGSAQSVAHGVAALDIVDEVRAGGSGQLQMGCGGERIVVRTTGDRHSRTDDADLAVTGGSDGASYGWMDDLDDRYVIALTGVAQARAGRSVAGDDEGFDAVVDEMVHDLERERPDLRQRARTVRRATGVTDVEHRLVRQLVEDRAGNRQAA